MLRFLKSLTLSASRQSLCLERSSTGLLTFRPCTSSVSCSSSDLSYKQHGRHCGEPDSNTSVGTSSHSEPHAYEYSRHAPRNKRLVEHDCILRSTFTQSSLTCHRTLMLGHYINNNNIRYISTSTRRSTSEKSGEPSLGSNSVVVAAAETGTEIPSQSVDPVASTTTGLPPLPVNQVLDAPPPGVAGAAAAAAVSSAGAVAASRRMLVFPDFPTIQAAEAAIYYTHLATGIQWWAAIALTAFIARTALILPLRVHEEHNRARLDRLGPEIQALTDREHLNVAKMRKQFFWNDKRCKREMNIRMREHIRELRIRDNCHPLKNIASVYLQIPVWVSLSWGLRNISTRGANPSMEHHSDYTSLSHEGIAWFTDLTAVDSTWLLPVLMGAVTLFNIEFQYLNLPSITKWRRYLTYFLRGVVVLIVPVCSMVPSTMSLYWVTSGVFAAITNLLINQSRFRRAFRLPHAPYETDRPLRDFFTKAKAHYFKKKS